MTYDKMILGNGVSVSMDCARTGVNNNVIVCGGSGSGKTMSISEPLFLETFNKSIIATVTKRRIVEKYKPMFLDRGYEVVDINFANPSLSDAAYDPLQYVRSYEDITYLAHAIVYANPQKEKNSADPYWDQSAASLLAAEIGYVMMTQENPSFADVLAFHDNLKIIDSPGQGQIETNVDDKYAALEAEAPNCFAVNCWKTFRQLPVKTASCIYSSLNTTIDTIFNPKLREMMSLKRRVDFSQIATHKTVLFVTSSPVNPSLNCFVNMFYGTAFKELFEFAEEQPDGRLPIPVHMLCDDFATGGRILNFPEYISVFREKQISVTLLLQSESQLESMYDPGHAATIINNCDTYVYMGGMDLLTNQRISLRLNAPMEDVLWMPVGETMVFRRGQKPVVTTRYNITKNKIYQDVTEKYEERIAKAIR